MQRGKIIEDITIKSSWKEAQVFQRSRIKWTLEGDLNSSFFHEWIRMREKKNEIQGLWSDGVWADSVKDVKNRVFHHFQKHFDSTHFPRPVLPLPHFPKHLEPVDNIFLTVEFSEEEIKNVIWSIDSNGSPGPDGFTFGFYKANWEIVKGDIMKVMQKVHSNSRFVKGFNPSFLCLIPKCPSPSSIEEYRPIFLISSAYKIIVKTLADRLSKVIDVVVSNNQTTFIKGRHIMDGILILNEALDEAKKKKLGRFLFKVDFAKAFDSID